MAKTNTTSQRLRVGFVGAGGIAPEHAAALRLVPGVEVIAVCDLDKFRAQQLAHTCDIPQVYASIPEMLASAQLDAVHVLTPPQYHAAVAIECLHGGAHVYVEKPLALCTEDCRKIAAVAQQVGLKVAVNHQLVHSPLMEQIAGAIHDRRFGRIQHVSVVFCNPGVPTNESNHFVFSTPSASLFELCPHPFSVIRRLVGRPLEVAALASDPQLLANGKVHYRSWQISSVSDRGTAQLFFSVARGNPEVRVWIYGEDASAEADLLRGTLLFHESSPFPVTAHLRDGVRNSRKLFSQSTGKMLDDRLVKLTLKPQHLTNRFYPPMKVFYDSLRGGRPLVEDVDAGESVVAYCEMAAANMKTIG